MKHILLILFTALSFSAIGQTVPMTNNVPWYEYSKKLSVGKFMLKSSGEYDTSFTIPSITASITLDTIAADKTVTFPDGSAYDKGVLMYLENTNNSAFIWNVAGNVKEADGTVISTIPNGTAHIFKWSLNAWIRLSTSGGSSPTVDTLTFSTPLVQLDKNVSLDFDAFPQDTIGVVEHNDSLFNILYSHTGLRDSTFIVLLSATSTNIYNSNGSLTGNRTVTMGSNGLTFSSTSIGPQISSSSTGLTITAAAGLGISAQANGTDPIFYGTNERAATNTAVETFTTKRTTSGTPAAGIGQFWGQMGANTSGTTFYTTKLKSWFTDPSAGTEKTKFALTGIHNGVEADWLTSGNNGALQLNKYGVGTFTGTPAYTLQVDASGNIIEGSVSGGAGTVTNVATGYGLSGGPITTTGTLKADSNSLATRAILYKVADSTYAAIGLKMTNVLTTTGDVIYSSSGTTAARLGIGTAGQVLTTTSGIPAWATPLSVSGFTTSLVTVASKNKSGIFGYTGSFRLFGHQDSTWTTGTTYVLADGEFFGYRAAENNTGTQATAMGMQAMYNNTGTRSTGLGYNALYNNTGGNSVGVGGFSLYANSGTQAVGIGYQAGQNNTGGSSTAVGYVALQNNTGASSTGVGNTALNSNTGSNATGIGASAMQSNTGASATGIGFQALQNNIGTAGTGVGYQSLVNNTGDFSNGFGFQAIRNNVSTSVNAIGYTAAQYNNWPSRLSIGHQTGNTWTVGSTKTFASADVSGTTITITAHGFGTVGQKVNLVYNLLTGTTVGGLTNGSTYQFTITSANVLTLSTISSAGSGTYNLTKDVDKTGSIEIGNAVTAEKANQAVIGTTSLVETRLYGALKYDSISRRKMIFEGDSYTSDAGDWPYLIGDSIPYFKYANIRNYATGGNTTIDMRSQYATEAHTEAISAGWDYWFMILGGINDLRLTSIASDSIYANLRYIWSQARADGFKVVAFTILKTGDIGARDSVRINLNAMILANPTLYDHVVDFDKVLDYNVDAAPFADAVHPGATGNALLAGAIKRTMANIPYTLSSTSGISKSPTEFNMVLNGNGEVTINKLNAGSSIVGTATLVGGTVTISTTKVTANSKIFITRNTTGGTLGNLSCPSASISAGTSFVINSSSGTETSTVNWFIIN